MKLLWPRAHHVGRLHPTLRHNWIPQHSNGGRFDVAPPIWLTAAPTRRRSRCQSTPVTSQAGVGRRRMESAVLILWRVCRQTNLAISWMVVGNVEGDVFMAVFVERSRGVLAKLREGCHPVCQSETENVNNRFGNSSVRLWKFAFSDTYRSDFLITKIELH